MDYVSAHGIPDLERLVAAIGRMYRAKLSTHPLVDASIEVENLPPFSSLPIMEFRKLRMKGILDFKDFPRDSFLRVLAHAKSNTHISNTYISVGFEEARSKQTSRFFDSFSTGLEKGQWFFGYSASGSLVATDKAYARQFLTRLESIQDVPIRVDVRGADFYLRHSQGGNLRITRSETDDKNPTGFRCEMPGATAEIVLRVLERCLLQTASPKSHQYSWNVYPLVFSPEHAVLVQIYDAVFRMDALAGRYEVALGFTISNLARASELQCLCGPRDEIVVSLGSCMLDNDNYLNFDVKVTSKGVGLKLESRLPVDQKDLSKALGIEVVVDK